jgi:hypothetical protein
VADKPYRVSDSVGAKFAPEQVLAGSSRNYSIRLFVRPSQSEKYLHVGELTHLSVLIKSIHADRGAVHFKLTPTIPSKVLAELGGLHLGEMDVVVLDEAFDRMKQVTTVRDRLDILQQVVNFWHGPIKPEDGMSGVEQVGGVPLPLPLQFWYGWAGKRTEVMTGQNKLFTPRDYRYRSSILRVVNGRLHFHVENQGVYQWSTLPDGEDPPVFGRYKDDEPWAPEGVRLSEHLILTCLFEAIMCHAKYKASAAWLDEARLAAVVEHIPPLAIGPWRWIGLKFFVRGGAFMCAAVNGEDNGKKYYSVSIGAKTEQPLQFLKSMLDKSWELVAI